MFVIDTLRSSAGLYIYINSLVFIYTYLWCFFRILHVIRVTRFPKVYLPWFFRYHFQALCYKCQPNLLEDYLFLIT